MKGDRGAAALSAPRLAIAAALALAFATAPLSGASATGGQDGGSHSVCDDKNGHRSVHGKGHHGHASGKGHANGKGHDDKGKDKRKDKGKDKDHGKDHGRDKGKGKHGDDSGHGKDKGCKGKIVIEKQTHPAGSAQAFTFTAASLDADGFALKDDESVTFDNLTPGTFAVSENATSGWELLKIRCHDKTEDTTVSGSTATIKVAAARPCTACSRTSRRRPRARARSWSRRSAHRATPPRSRSWPRRWTRTDSR